MPTIRLPGGHRITGVPDIRPGRDFTPTLQEAFWAFVMPPNVFRIFSDKSGEQLFYFGSKFTVATVGAYMASGQSLMALNMMRGVQFMTSPITVAAAGLLALNYAYTRDLSRRSMRYKMLHASGMDPASMTQPITPPYSGGPSGAGY